jgi:hypothetical protein
MKTPIDFDICEETFEPEGPKPLSVRRPSEILGMVFDPADMLLDNGYLTKGNALSIVGMGGLGKSRVVLQLAVSCILGRPFCGWKTQAEGLRWLIIQTENGNRRLQYDLARMTGGMTPDELAKLDDHLFIHTLEHDEDTFVSLGNPEGQQRVADAIAYHSADIVVYDVLRDFGAGDLNADQFMTETCRAIGSITRRGNPKRIPLVVHHALTGRAGAAKATGFDRGGFGRNSKVLQGWTRAQINLAPFDADNNDVLVVASGKANDAVEFEPFAVRLNPETMTYDRDDSADLEEWRERMGDANAKKKARVTIYDVQKRVQESGIDGMTKKEIVTHLKDERGIGKTKAYELVEGAAAKKLIRLRRDEKYVHPDLA